MKPCPLNRKSLALLAIGAPEDEGAQELRAHLEGCAGCREYLAQMQRVTDRLRDAEPLPKPQPSLYLHRRVRQKLHERESKRTFQWRLAAAAAAVVIVLLFTHRGSQPQQTVASTPAVRHASDDSDVSILNYEMLANESLDKLDQTLSEQGSRSLLSAPVYRAGSLAAANALDQPGS